MKFRTIVALVATLVLAGCQSAPPASPKAPPAEKTPATESTTVPAPTVAPVVYDPSSVTVGNTGFSPRAQNPANTLGFSLHFGSPDKILSWRLEFTAADGTVVQTVTGNPPELPPTLSWDGKADDGLLAREGLYTARLSVDYGDPKGPSVADSKPFLLDVTPPSGSVAVTPQPYEPGDPDIMVNPPQVTFAVNLIPGAAPIATWRLSVIHPNGSRFMDFISEDHKNNTVSWNGRAQNNASLEAGATYRLVIQAFDQYGNMGTFEGSLEVATAAPVPAEASTPGDTSPADEAAPVTVKLDGKLIAGITVYFPAFSADLSKVKPFKLVLNKQAFDTLAEAIRTVPNQAVKIIGHANKVFWDDKTKGDKEQKEVLIPLSLARATAVRDALVERGLPTQQFTLTGIGADDPLVPFQDFANNWKNRRVEFEVAP